MANDHNRQLHRPLQDYLPTSLDPNQATFQFIGEQVSRCNSCGNAIDDCNESQPVCPYCGECYGRIPSEHFSTLSSLIDLPHLYRADPRGIRNEVRLRGLCLRCGGVASGSAFRVCSHCGNTWRVNHCLSCGRAVDSRDPETPPCPNCGWLICHKCGACRCQSCR